VPCEDWLRVVMNRIDPELFQACFTDWARGLRPDAPDLIAVDGKTSRRTHDRSRGRRALHLVSAWATGERLVLTQEAVDEKENECAAIPDLLDPLALDGALVTIDAIACNPAMATAIPRPRRQLSPGGRGQSADPAEGDHRLFRAGPGR
jgi:hypothetical protein